jgi:succinyl-diaminopimelate desuccinylase
MSESAVLALTKALIERPSVTPDDAGCQRLISARLGALGFNCEDMRFDDVDNLWAVLGDDGPLFVFAGHTDVVPTGPEAEWQSPPFAPEVRDGKLYGRGAADMKGSLAAMIVATERLVTSGAKLNGRIGYLLTSDEEGPAINGTVKVMDELLSRQEKIDWCIVGEPSSTDVLGDIIKNGRRGSISGHLVAKGIQGHIAYPHLARNPVHDAMPALHALTSHRWDEGSEHFPPTSFQISNINAGTGASNVIPGTLTCDFNLRFSTALTADDIKRTASEILDQFDLDYTLDWSLSGNPFLTESGSLLQETLIAIKETTGVDCQPSTSGGTSDGRFIAPHGVELLELGPCNATIHKVDENVDVAALDQLADVYEAILRRLLC